MWQNQSYFGKIQYYFWIKLLHLGQIYLYFWETYFFLGQPQFCYGENAVISGENSVLSGANTVVSGASLVVSWGKCWCMRDKHSYSWAKYSCIFCCCKIQLYLRHLESYLGVNTLLIWSKTVLVGGKCSFSWANAAILGPNICYPIYVCLAISREKWADLDIPQCVRQVIKQLISPPNIEPLQISSLF